MNGDLTVLAVDKINEFLCDENYLALVEGAREQRLLFITDMSETRVSAFLGWLFRPYEGHGLGDQAVRELLHNAWLEVHSGDWNGPRPEEMGFDQWSPVEIAAKSFRDLCVETEYRFGRSEKLGEKNRPIDVALVSRANRLLVLIENKFGSAVHSGQLKSYREQAEKSYPGYAVFHIYLDPNADNQPDDQPHWIPLRYGWLVDLISARQRSGLLSERALNALSQVKDYLNQDEEGGGDEAYQANLAALVNSHHDVLMEMRRIRLMNRHGRLTATLKDVPRSSEILLVEYHQRPRLWDDVFDQMDHLPFINALRKLTGDQLEVQRRHKRLFIRDHRWVSIRDQVQATGVDSAWGIRLAAWKPDGDNCYSVRSVIDFNSGSTMPDFSDDREKVLREVAASLREFRRKASSKDRWIRLKEQAGLSPEKAALMLADEATRINGVLHAAGLISSL